MKYFLIYILLLIFHSCSNTDNPKEAIFEINPENFSENHYSLSRIADDISYIPLDNVLPIGLIYSIEINKSSIYLSTKNIGILQFDRQGKYVRTLSRKGRGPGEFNYGWSFSVDEKIERIYVVDRHEIKVYTEDGIFIRSIPTGKYIDGPADDIEMIGSNLFLPSYGRYGNFKYNWIILDTLGNLISEKESFDHSMSDPQEIRLQSSPYKFENKIFYYNLFNDTIFSISPELEVQVAYLFSKGNFRWPKNGFILKPEAQSVNQLKNLFKPTQMFETKSYIFLNYSFAEKVSVLLIDKKTKKTYQGSIDEKTEKINSNKLGILNDIDGGMLFYPDPLFYYYTEDDSEYIATMINPFELKNYIASEEFKNSTPIYPEKKKQLEQLANSLDENDNPVLMLVKLKN